jgi:hypothetical protein
MKLNYFLVEQNRDDSSCCDSKKCGASKYVLEIRPRLEENQKEGESGCSGKAVRQ